MEVWENICFVKFLRAALPQHMFICVGLAGAKVWHCLTFGWELKELQFYIQGLALSARLYPEPTRSSFQRFVHILMTREIKYFAHREELAWTKNSR